MIKVTKQLARQPSADEGRLHRAVRAAAKKFGLDPADLYLSVARSIEDAVRRADGSDETDRDYTRQAFPEHVRTEAAKARKQ